MGNNNYNIALYACLKQSVQQSDAILQLESQLGTQQQQQQQQQSQQSQCMTIHSDKASYTTLLLFALVCDSKFHVLLQL
jgi:hypothetical protein